MRVAVLVHRSPDAHSADPLPSAEMLADDLRAEGYDTGMSIVSARGLGVTSPETADDSTLGAELVFVHAETPVDVIADLRRRSQARICLYGPFAGECFAESGVDFALVGPISDAPARLARTLCTDPSLATLSSFPRLLYRMPSGLCPSDDWSPPRFEDWSRARTHPRRGALSVPSSAIPEGPPVGILTLPHAQANGTSRAYAVGKKRDLSATPSDSPAVFAQIHASARPHQDVLWTKWAPRESHPNDLLDRPFSLLWDEGVRHFRLICENPFPIWSQWLDHLDRQGTLPKEIELSPDVEAIRAAQSELDKLLSQATHLGIRVVFSGIPFLSFIDRSARLFGVQRSHWETRAVARLLLQIDLRHREHDLTSRSHQICLLDPWTTIEDILDQLQTIDEDAPFLKGALDLTSRLQIRSSQSAVARAAAAEDLLIRTETGAGFDFRFATPGLERFQNLYPNGLVPLYEAVGRMRLEALVQDQIMIEARFRWARELALFLQENPEPGRDSETWGRIVARVVQSLQVDHPRSAR